VHYIMPVAVKHTKKMLLSSDIFKTITVPLNRGRFQVVYLYSIPFFSMHHRISVLLVAVDLTTDLTVVVPDGTARHCGTVPR